MLQIVSPKFTTTKELKNLSMTISHYVDSVSIQLRGKDGYLKYHKSYNSYNESAIDEIKEFIKMYDDQIETNQIADATKLYFELINQNW